MHDHATVAGTITGIDPPQITEVASGVYAYVQPDGTWWINNAGFIVGSEGVTLIDTCATEERTRLLLAAIGEITDAPVRIVVNTHHHGDHTHGNSLTASATIIAHRLCRSAMQATGIKRYEEAFTQPNWGALSLRTPNITFESRLDLWSDDRPIELHYIGGTAHTTNDVVAWLPDEKVLFTGDLVFNGGTPFVVMGSVPGSLRAVERLRSFDAQTIVPGHGPVCGAAVFDGIERYLTMVQTTAVAAIDDHLTPLEAARAVDLGEFAVLSDSERLVGNLHRAMAELAGPEANAAMSVGAAIADMIEFNGGELLHCVA